MRPSPPAPLPIPGEGGLTGGPSPPAPLPIPGEGGLTAGLYGIVQRLGEAARTGADAIRSGVRLE